MTEQPTRGHRAISRVVQIVVVLAFVAGIALLLRRSVPEITIGQRCEVSVLFRDASRLAIGSPVKIAGVRVGEVVRMSLSDSLARVDMRLRDDVVISANSWIGKRAESAFGDNYLEITPNDTGSPAPMIRCGVGEQWLVHVEEGGSTDSALRAIARAMPRVDRGLDAVHDGALDARRWANRTLVPALDSITRWADDPDNLTRPLERARRGMASFDDGTARAQDAVAGAKPRIERGLDRANELAANARRNIADIKSGVQGALGDVRTGIDRVDPTLDQIGDVVAAIDEGGRGRSGYQGTLGRLVNEHELADTIDDIAEVGADAVAGYVRFKSYLGLRVELDILTQVPRVYVTAEERVRHDKFYLIEVEQDNLGALPGDQLTEHPAVGPYTRTQSITDGLRFTFQFGKTFWDRVQLRAGIKESTFGIGGDAWAVHGRLKLSADLYGSFQYTPRLKLTAALRVFRSIYVLGGVDDVLNQPGQLPVLTGTPPGAPPANQLARLPFGRDIFIGAALHFDDADLSALLRVYGALVVGLLATKG
jgi:phospholipid/cholesterol/gamma-HCH transport system substrate-binding protein